MNLDPFSKNGLGGSSKGGSSADEIFVKNKNGGAGRRAAPAEAPEAMDIPIEAAEPEPEAKKKTAKLTNPVWSADKVGFNEETPVSVDLELPEDLAHKTKVTFELFAKTPKGPESISKGEAVAEGGKAVCKIPVYIPAYQDEDGNRMQKVEYYFLAKHSEAEPLDGSKAPKLVDEKADRVIESHVVEGVTFEFNSSFLHPKHAAKLKAMCALIGEWRKKDPEGKLASFGHADLVGDETYNKGLSERRARSVHALLVKDPEAWEALHKEEKWDLSPVQSLLQHAGEDPGTVDGKDGPKTQAAVKSFQGKNGLAESGTADAETRKKLYKKFMDDCNALDLKAKDFDVIDGNPHAGCSEYNPLEKTEAKSETNRRVTVLFLKSNKNFPINYPCKKGSIAPCQAQVKKKPGERRRASYGCFFYDDLVKEEKKGGGDVPARGKLKLVGVKAGEDVKQYVNLKADKAKPELGKERLIEAEIEGGADGAKVFWKVTAAKENSKRNDPKAGVKPDEKGALVEFKAEVAEIETAVKGGKASFVLACGLAGGDVFTVEAGLEKGKAEGTVKVVTWRKAWYQITLEKGMVLPALTNFIDAYKLAFIGVERTKDKEFEKKDAPARTFYPQWMVSKGGADKEVAVIGSHNKLHYQGLLDKVEAEKPKAHMIICQHQFDEGDLSKKIEETLTAGTSPAIKTNVVVFNPPLSGNLVSGGTWKSLAPVGHADHGKSGALSDADIILEKGRTSLREFKVKLPATAPVPGIGHGIGVTLRLRGVKGPFLGESDGNQILAVFDPTDPTDFQNTLTHELGHTFNQTPDPAGQSPGLPDHPHQYREHGGQGPHCSTILTAGKETKGVEVEVDDPDNAGKKMKIYETGVCVMFHSGPQPGCLNRYCDTCLPYVKATDFSDFGKA